MGKRRKRTKTAAAPSMVEKFLRPTPQREAHNDFRSEGVAHRVVPVIVRLHEAGVLNDREYAALAYYRDQALLADKSPMRSCIDFSPKGGHGPGVAILSAQLETGRIERDAGALWSLLRAVAVDDVPLPALVEAKLGTFWQRGKSDEAIRARLNSEIGFAAMELKYVAGGILPCAG